MIDNTALENKLQALKIPGRTVSVSDNDFYTLYNVAFNDDITLNKIRARREDISLFFEGSDVDIETDGGVILLKVPKKTGPNVSIYPFFKDLNNKAIDDQIIPFIIGKNEDGQRLYYDLCNMPHVLVGGATGSGKSVFMHNCIISTLYCSISSIILIDVKKVEFSIYDGIPHLCTPICYTARETLETLRKVCIVMDKRYETLKENNTRNITEYRKNGGKMQYMTIFIDELADLLMINKNIEKYIIRIAQLGRAAGIHLVMATQRPDASVLSGLIRANIPSRVCFAVQKAMDSRIILDMPGGERLKGKGDGLFLPIGSRTPIHFQAPYISTSDLLETIETARHCND
jgi:S-DNA-T family DNA segregation ATPase FtsK/SpoIIIE